MPDATQRSGRVFVSSTCYDLLDARSQLEGTLREAGLSPVMSDRPSSEFVNTGDTNSIETCLVNLRSCEHCVVVLSQRYGPSLRPAGFDDISATHLEYREALKAHVPVSFYIRDRLWGEFDVERRTGSITSVWAKEGESKRLFNFIDEHKKLTNTSKSNWIWPFTSSVDLCERVLQDLGSTATAGIIRKLSEQGRLPQFSIDANGENGNRFSCLLSNTGAIHAARVTLLDHKGRQLLQPRELPPGTNARFDLEFHIADISACNGNAPVLSVGYETPTGERLADLFALLPARHAKVRIVPVGRSFAGRSLRSTAPEVTSINGFVTVPMGPINAAH